MYPIIAPWVNETPLFLHLISDNSSVIKEAVDSCTEVGFDMVIQSFGSGMDHESEDEDYLARKKADFDYAHSKGIEIGGYTLAVVEDYKPVEQPWAMNGDPNSILRCLATDWSEGYWNRIKNFITKTGADFIEIDGPYHFYTCDIGNKSDAIKAEHNHAGLSDSRYAQWKASTLDMFSWLKENDVFINAPDWMFLNGSNKSGIGYVENGWSQPRQEQLTLGRLAAYSGTYYRKPSMGWSFIPIEQYHGGGSAAIFEPLNQNLVDYEWAMAEAFAAGVQPCFRGKELFDTEETKEIVKYWTSLYKRYNKLLNSNTIHFMMPEMDPNNYSRTLGIDAILQECATEEKEKGFLMLFNQTDTARTEKITVPLYYTGLTGLDEPPQPAPGSHPANIKNVNGYVRGLPPFLKTDDVPDAYPEATPTDKTAAFYQEGVLESKREYIIDSNGNVEMYVTIPPMSFTWFTIADPETQLDEPIPYPREIGRHHHPALGRQRLDSLESDRSGGCMEHGGQPLFHHRHW